MNRLDFEESALKNIDLSLSPPVADFKSESPVSESKKAPLSVRTVHVLSITCTCVDA